MGITGVEHCCMLHACALAEPLEELQKNVHLEKMKERQRNAGREDRMDK